MVTWFRGWSDFSKKRKFESGRFPENALRNVFPSPYLDNSSRLLEFVNARLQLFRDSFLACYHSSVYNYVTRSLVTALFLISQAIFPVYGTHSIRSININSTEITHSIKTASLTTITTLRKRIWDTRSRVPSLTLTRRKIHFKPYSRTFIAPRDLSTRKCRKI